MPHDLNRATPQQFLTPHEVRCGDGAVAELGQMLQGWQVTTGAVLLVCDKVLHKLGHVTQVQQALADASFSVDVFDDVEGEPDSATARTLVEVVRRRDYVAVVGMGGGSSMDLAKVAAALATNTGDVQDIVGVDRVHRPSLPLALVPTTAGTGSEATRIAMISHAGKKQIINDANLVPRGAVLDPLLVAALPPAVTAATGLDAIAHAVEASLSLNASVLTSRAALEAVELLSTNVPKAYHDGSDLTARRGTLYGAYLAGLALNAGSVLGHSMGYTIAHRAKLPHGVTVGMALPYCLAYASAAATDRIEQIFARVQGTATRYDDIYDWLTTLTTELGLPTSLREIGITASEADEMALECVRRYPRPNNPVPLDEERVTQLYRFFHSGDLAGCVALFGR